MVEPSDGGPRICACEERVDLSNNALIEFLQPRRNQIKKDFNWGTGGKVAYDRGTGEAANAGRKQLFSRRFKIISTLLYQISPLTRTIL